MATRLRRKLGYEDHARIPAGGKRQEILDGELYVTPAPTPLHQRLSTRLQRPLEDHVEARGLGEAFNAPLDVILGLHDVAPPDLLVVGDPAQVSGRGIEGAPLLIVEVLSPSSRAQDRSVKTRRYAASGVAHYWVLDPDAETLECLWLEGGACRSIGEARAPGTLTHPDWPDLAIDLGALWR